jgi:hypothetical protein
MAKREVVESTCDRCHKEEVTPLTPTTRRGEYQVPDGWIHVAANSKSSTLFEMDLCDDCKQNVLAAAGLADRLS